MQLSRFWTILDAEAKSIKSIPYKSIKSSL